MHFGKIFARYELDDDDEHFLSSYQRWNESFNKSAFCPFERSIDFVKL